MKIKKTIRNSSIEFIKLIAIIFIVVSHAVPDGNTGIHPGAINISMATTDISIFIAGLFKNLGQIGNAIFLVCSFWFLLDSKKSSLNKILYMMADCFVISVLWLGVFLLSNYKLPGQIIIRQFFPVILGNSWFLTCYILLYLIHPFLNLVIRNIKKETLLLSNIVFIMLYGVIGLILNGTQFYYSKIVGFIGVYFIVGYVKLYLEEKCKNQKRNVIMLIAGVSFWLMGQVITNHIGLHFDILKYGCQKWNTFVNPCFILIAFSMFNISRQFEFKSRFVNFVSGSSLLIYMIHTNRLIRDFFRFDFFDYIKEIYNHENLIGWILGYALIFLIGSTILAAIYQFTIKKISVPVCDKIANYILRKEYAQRKTQICEKIDA